MFRLTTIARPYARAAFNFAVENQSVERWHEMLELVSRVSSNKQVAKLLDSMVATETLFNIFIAICGNQLDQYGKNFIHIMAINKRLLILPAVLQQFIELRNSLKSTIKVNVLSTIRLSDKQKVNIVLALEKRLSRKVQLNYKIDQSILAGIIIRFGDIVIDGSTRGRLERLKDVLQQS